MNAVRDLALAPEIFFLPGAQGGRLCVFHPPAAQVALRGAVLYIHPFAEEMNCARRMAALQARRLADCGFGVLQIDLTGCGDSCGEFGDARWSVWRDDIVDATRWLASHCSPAISLWGLRLGALLALDCAARLDAAPKNLLMWSPVLDGRQHLTQFLRLALARQMSDSTAPRYADTQAMRSALADGAMLEIAGYDLSGRLAADLDALDGAGMVLRSTTAHWIDIAAGADRMPAASQRVIDAWRLQGMRVDTRLVDAPAFWSVPAQGASAALIDASCQMLLEQAA